MNYNKQNLVELTDFGLHFTPGQIKIIISDLKVNLDVHFYETILYLSNVLKITFKKTIKVAKVDIKNISLVMCLLNSKF